MKNMKKILAVLALSSVAAVFTVAGTAYGEGYIATDRLWIKAVINTDEGPLEAVFHKGGENLTERGDTVVWGYFYADPADVSWGHEDNPDLYVKIWYDVTGRIDVNFFHVSVPSIEVYTDYPYDGTYDKRGTATTDDRYVRHEYWKTPDDDEPDSAVYPMFTDDNGNGINDYLEEDTHFSGSESQASSRSSRNPAHHGGQPDSGYAMQQGRALYGHAFTDMDGDGVCDYGQNGSGTWHGPGFTDGDQDGVCDYWDADSPLYNHHHGMYFQDQNLNMINDYSESQWHDGYGHSFTDTDGDGVCDYAQNGTDTCWHGPGFTDGDSNGVCDHWDVGGWGHGSHHYRP